MKKILVTGAFGFLGSHIVEAEIKRGNMVFAMDNFSRGKFNFDIYNELPVDKMITVIGDVLNLELLKKIVSKVDLIYHFAALPSHRLALERPREYILIDLLGTENVLEAARLSSKKPLVVFASSNKVYGKQPCPWKENKLPQPEGPYALAKWSAEKLCEMYNKYYKIPSVVLRYHHVAGKRSNPELALSVFTEQALKGETLEVHGKWENKRFTPCSANYTHIDDAIRATLLAVDKYKRFNTYNIANKEETKVHNIALYVHSKLNSNATIKNIDMLPHETLNHISDVSKAEEELGFTAEIPIEKAFEDYIKWRVK